MQMNGIHKVPAIPELKVRKRVKPLVKAIEEKLGLNRVEGMVADLAVWIERNQI